MENVSRVRELAFFSIGRGCFFAMLGIWTVMFGMVGWPILAVRSGAILATLGWAVLIIRALRANRRDYRSTEVWVLLGRPPAWPRERLQTLIGGILRETYMRFADFAALFAIALWLAALLLGWLGFKGP